MSQTTGLYPALYDNTKKTTPKRKKPRGK